MLKGKSGLPRRIRVVLADDHPLVLEGLRAMLRAEEDMEVVAAVTDGAELIPIVERHRPDVVVLDLQMPGLSGWDCLEAIRRAELIVLGPGSLYSSVIPSFLPPQIKDAILRSPGRLCYILNAMSEKGETDHLSALEHYRAIVAHLGRAPEVVVAHTHPIGHQRLARYEAEGQHPVALDLEGLEAEGVRVLRGDFLEDGPYAQHDPAKVVRALMNLRTS